MNPGDVVLVPITEITGAAKLRPAVVLALLPGTYQSLPICGISTQTHAAQPNWDDPIAPGDPDFVKSGLRQPSVICLSFIRAAGPSEIVRVIGTLDFARFTRLRQRLSDHLRP